MTPASRADSTRFSCPSRSTDSIVSPSRRDVVDVAVEMTVSTPSHAGVSVAGCLPERAQQERHDRPAAATAEPLAARARRADAATPEARRLWRTRCVAVRPAASGPPRKRDKRRKGTSADPPTALAARGETEPRPDLQDGGCEARLDLVFARASITKQPRCEPNRHFETLH